MAWCGPVQARSTRTPIAPPITKSQGSTTSARDGHRKISCDVSHCAGNEKSDRRQVLAETGRHCSACPSAPTASSCGAPRVTEHPWWAVCLRKVAGTPSPTAISGSACCGDRVESIRLLSARRRRGASRASRPWISKGRRPLVCSKPRTTAQLARPPRGDAISGQREPAARERSSPGIQ